MDNTEVKMPLCISIKTAAARYGISTTTVRNLMLDDDFPYIYRIGKKICIPLVAFDGFMTRYMVPHSLE